MHKSPAFIASLLLFQALSFSLSGQSYDIFAIKFGERKNRVSLSREAIGDQTSDSTKVFFMFWLLKNKDRTVLVDAGFTADAEVDTSTISFNQPEKLLSTLGIEPDQVTDIILSHPHWDHMGGIDLYPRAVVWMQEADFKDLQFKKKNPESAGYNPRDLEKIMHRQEKGLLRLLKGKRDEDILPGITVITGSKHTPGSQFVMTNNGRQTVIIASDNCKYYRNLAGPFASPSTSDPAAYIHNLQLMNKYVSGATDFIIPGHDPLVFTKFKLVSRDIVKIL